MREVTWRAERTQDAEPAEHTEAASREVMEARETVESAHDAADDVDAAAEVNEARDIGEVAREAAEDLTHLREVVAGVNPGYDPFRETARSKNCGACARATELRVTGRDPEAVASTSNIGSVRAMEQVTGRKQVAMKPDEILDYALHQPEGFTTVMGLEFRVGSGHWVNLVRTRSGVYVLDGQCGGVWTFGRYFDLMGPHASRWDIGVASHAARKEGGTDER